MKKTKKIIYYKEANIPQIIVLQFYNKELRDKFYQIRKFKLQI